LLKKYYYKENIKNVLNVLVRVLLILIYQD